MTEKKIHREFLRYQIQLEKAIDKLHADTARTLNDIIAKNAGPDGKINRAKVEKIVNDYIERELRVYRLELQKQIKIGVADSTHMGVKAILGELDMKKGLTKPLWRDAEKVIRDEIISKRGLDGLTLSDRVWKITDDNVYQLKKTIGADILDGKSASTISRDIRGYLRQPETMRGAAKDALEPGVGVYKSAYKNAMRVTRTETNRAYIDGQKEVAKKMGYMLQFNVSGSHPEEDECDDFDGQIFEPDEFPAPVHPNCMCYATTVLPEGE